MDPLAYAQLFATKVSTNRNGHGQSFGWFQHEIVYLQKKNTSFSSVIGTSITLTITVCTASTVCTIKHHSLATGNA